MWLHEIKIKHMLFLGEANKNWEIDEVILSVLMLLSSCLRTGICTC